MMLQMQRAKALLADVNPRSEFHGEECVSAGDLKFEVTLPNQALDGLFGGLRKMLYYYDAARAADLADKGSSGDPEFLPHVRIPDLHMPLRWDGTLEDGVVCTVHAKGKDIVLNDCKLNNVQFECKDHGLVEFTFRVQAHPDEKQMGRLCHGLIQTEVEVTIAPGPASTQENVPGTEGAGGS